MPGGVAIKKADIGVIDEPSRRPSKKKIERPTDVSRGQPVRQCRQELSDLGIVNDKRHVLGIRTDLARDKGEGAASRAPGDGGGMLGSSMNHAAEHDPRAEAPLTGRGGTLRAGPCPSRAVDALIASRMPHNSGAPQDLLSRLIPRPDAPAQQIPSPECSSSAARQPRTGIGIRRKALDLPIQLRASDGSDANRSSRRCQGSPLAGLTRPLFSGTAQESRKSCVAIVNGLWRRD